MPFFDSRVKLPPKKYVTDTDCLVDKLSKSQKSKSPAVSKKKTIKKLNNQHLLIEVCINKTHIQN